MKTILHSFSVICRCFSFNYWSYEWLLSDQASKSTQIFYDAFRLNFNFISLALEVEFMLVHPVQDTIHLTIDYNSLNLYEPNLCFTVI